MKKTVRVRTCDVKKIVLLTFVLVLLSTATGVVFIKPAIAEATIYITPDVTVTVQLKLNETETSTLSLPFAGLLMLGFDTIGDIGLWLTLTTVFSSLIPVKPLVGKALFNYRKDVSLVTLFLTGSFFSVSSTVA